MAERRYNVRATDIETGEETVQGPFWSGLAATTHAKRWADEFYGGEDATWVKWNGPSSFQVGQIREDGVHSSPTATITIDEEEDEEDAE